MKPVTKKLFLTKTQVHLGFVKLRVGDALELTFQEEIGSVARPVGTYKFMVKPEGL
jgi:hypothetical protein